LQIDGQDAIFIPGGQQAIQISGNQLLSSPNQAVVRQQNTQQNQQQHQQQTVFIPGIGNVSLGQFGGGQTVAVRQGNVVQTLQLPVQQTIPVQAISTQNGQTILQTIHLPIQALQSLNAGNVQHLTAQVVPQMQQVLQINVFICFFFDTIINWIICLKKGSNGTHSGITSKYNPDSNHQTRTWN
jgi:transcription factor Sp